MDINTNYENPTLVSHFVMWVCDYFKISPAHINIEISDDLSNNGYCIDVSDDEFLILVKGGRDIGNIFNTIAHEMIHVKQYIKENLGSLLDSCSDIPYMERWWEVEAFGNSADLVKKFADFYKTA